MIAKSYAQGSTRLRYEYICSTYQSDENTILISLINGHSMTLTGNSERFFREYDAWCNDPQTELEKYENIGVAAMTKAGRLQSNG